MRTLLLFLLLCFTKQASAQCNPVATPSGPTTFCDGNSVVLTGSPGNTYQWYLNGSLIVNAINSTYTATTSGSYTVEIDSMGCVNMSPAVVVTVNTVPAQPGPITGPIDVCQGTTQTYTIDPVAGATSYLWGGGMGLNWGNFITTTAVPSITEVVGGAASPFTSPDAFVSVRAVNVCGQSTVRVLTVHTYDVVDLGGNNLGDVADVMGQVCVGPNSGLLVVQWFISQNGYGVATGYEWFRDGVAIPGSNSQSLSINEGGNYSVNVYTNMCYVTKTKNHLLQKVPTPHIYPVGNVTICDGSNATLNVDLDYTHYSGQAYELTWELNGVTIPGSTNITSIMPSTAGQYKVRLRNLYEPSNLNWYCNDSTDAVNVTFSGFIAPTVTITQNGNQLTATSGFNSYQWYRNGVLIPGATSNTYVIVNGGNHTVVVNDGNMCTASATLGLPIENVNETNFSVTVFPNPNQGSFSVSANIPRENNTALISILDITGKTILVKYAQASNGVAEQQIQLDNTLSSGMYFLKLSSGGFNKVVSFIKQ